MIIRSLVTFFVISSSFAAHAAIDIDLASADSFAVLGGSTVTNTGPTTISGDLGVSPGTSITGFGPGVVSGGTIHAATAAAIAAHASLVAAILAASAQTCGTALTGQDLGGLTLTPGVYCFAAAAALTGTLTLDSLGNPAPVYIFQIGSTLTTATGSSVVLFGPDQGDHVFWQVGSSATLGTASAFAGNILAQTSITLGHGASLQCGRALALNGAVTLDTNAVSIQSVGCESTPVDGGVPEPSIWAMLIAGLGLTGTQLRRRRLQTFH